MGCFFSKSSTSDDDDYASFINNDTRTFNKNDESIFIDDNNGINQYELNKLVINRLITLENNIEELSEIFII